MDTFFTLKDEMYSAEIVEKRSRFIAVIYKVTSEEEALKKLDETRRIHKAARHNVFAYRIEGNIERFSDDGEPSRNSWSTYH